VNRSSAEAGPPGVEAWTRPARTAAERQVRHADRMADELRRLGDRLRALTGVGRRDRVLDIGCGTGESTRDAGRIATAGSVLGIDISASVLERARRLTEQAGLRNVSYLQADAQVHRFPPEHFDVGISRFGAMFFTDLVAAFTNVGHALRPGARLVLMVWQDRDRNEWYTLVREAFGADASGHTPDTGADDPFALADPATTTSVLAAAGFTEVDFTEVREPVYYGPDTAAAYDFVAGMRHTQELLTNVDEATAEHARRRLRVALAERDTGSGVYIGSRAWIVTARRA
jgi:SAM-dependent methyltransferase